MIFVIQTLSFNSSSVSSDIAPKFYLWSVLANKSIMVLVSSLNLAVPLIGDFVISLYCLLSKIPIVSFVRSYLSLSTRSSGLGFLEGLEESRRLEERFAGWRRSSVETPIVCYKFALARSYRLIFRPFTSMRTSSVFGLPSSRFSFSD